MLLSGCRVPQHTVTSCIDRYATGQTERDSVFVYDSISVRIRSDTVYVEKCHTAYKDRFVYRTDTIRLESVRTETVRVRYVPRFYRYCAVLGAFVPVLFVLRVLLYLRRRFL